MKTTKGLDVVEFTAFLFLSFTQFYKSDKIAFPLFHEPAKRAVDEKKCLVKRKVQGEGK